MWNNFSIAKRARAGAEITLRTRYGIISHRLGINTRSARLTLLVLSRRGGQTVLMDCLLLRPFDSPCVRVRKKTSPPVRFPLRTCPQKKYSPAVVGCIFWYLHGESLRTRCGIISHCLGINTRSARLALLVLSRRGGQTVLMDCLLLRPFDSPCVRVRKKSRGLYFLVPPWGIEPQIPP